MRAQETARPRARRQGRPAPAVPIQSLQRGLGILETVARRDAGMGLGEVSREAGLHPSTTSHLLRTLVALGYLVQDEATRRYRVGPRVLQVAAATLGEGHLSETAGPLLAEMARATGETSHLAVFERGEVVVVNKIDGTGPVRLLERVGYPRPAHCTAIGKVLLAHLPPHDLAAYLAQTRLEAMTPKTITSPARLEAELERVRTRGHAVDDEEFARGIRCVAAPVRNFTGRVVAAVGVSGPIWRLSLARVARLTEVVRGSARRLSEQLGYRRGPGRNAGDRAERPNRNGR